MGGVVGIMLPEAYLEAFAVLIKAYIKRDVNDSIDAEISNEREFWRALTGGYTEGPNFASIYEDEKCDTLNIKSVAEHMKQILRDRTRILQDCGDDMTMRTYVAARICCLSHRMCELLASTTRMHAQELLAEEKVFVE